MFILGRMFISGNILQDVLAEKKGCVGLWEGFIDLDPIFWSISENKVNNTNCERFLWEGSLFVINSGSQELNYQTNISFFIKQIDICDLWAAIEKKIHFKHMAKKHRPKMKNISK